MYNIWAHAYVNLRKIYIILENHREYPHKPYSARIYSHWATSSSLIVWVYLHSNFHGGLRKTHVFWNTVRNGLSRSSKVVDFGTNRKRVCDFLLVINNNLVPIFPVSEMLQVSWEERPRPYSTRILGTFPLDYRLPMLWLRGAKTLS